MQRVFLFFTAIILSGIGGAGGSMLGNAFGRTGLWIGGIAGGLLASILAGYLAAKVGWIAPMRQRATTIGTAIGFLAAAAVAANTLSSPIGPVLSTALAGIGAVIGAGSRNRSSG
jgi:hypothetical protein